MARNVRQNSSTGIYHVILRGINRQQIFYDEEDYDYFIRLMDRFQEISHYEIYAYCLMGNHIHLLIRIHEEPLSLIFKRIGAAFVYWYNLIYNRVGHLFQDRFKSEPVEDDRYFLTVLRYILRNPVKAGICVAPQEYPYSNAKDFFRGKEEDLPCPLSGKELAEFISQDQDDICMDISESVRHGVTESVAMELIKEEFGDTAPVISAENRDIIERSIQNLSEKGLSIRQMSRLTGISKSIIERALRQDREPSPVLCFTLLQQ